MRRIITTVLIIFMTATVLTSTADAENKTAELIRPAFPAEVCVNSQIFVPSTHSPPTIVSATGSTPS